MGYFKNWREFVQFVVRFFFKANALFTAKF